MANHVYFNVTVDGNEECLKGFSSAMETHSVKRQLYDGTEYVRRELLDIDKLKFMPEGTYDKDGWLEDSWNYYVNNVGAKWCNVEEVGEHYFSGYSAWSPPVPMLNNLANYLGEGTILRMTYEDEFRNFIGVAWAEGDGTSDFEELDGEEVLEWLLEPLKLDEIPEDFEWWEPHPKLDDWTPQEYLDEKVYEWFNET